MVVPLSKKIPDAIRWFNWQYSFPKVWGNSLSVYFKRYRIGSGEKPLVMTCSISEDYARVWHYFAKQSLHESDWDFLIVDSSGDMNASLFHGCQVLRFFNIYHGRKVDILLRKAISSELIFLCDDDRYILGDVSMHLAALGDPLVPVVSVAPRTWWKFKINGQEFLPMGSYGLLFKRSVFLKHRLHFQSPSHYQSIYKVFPPEVKPQWHHDTADYANERLLQLGYRIATISDHPMIQGFSGLSGQRIVLMKYGKEYLKQALLEVKHYREGSGIGGAIRSLYDIVKFEHLYQLIFSRPPRFVSGFSERDLFEIVEQNPRVELAQKERVFEHFKQSDLTYEHLRSLVALRQFSL